MITSAIDKDWWHKATFYQIYPKSFNDTTGNGIGDIQGIIDKLDYLKELGVEGLWLTPIYLSPQIDNGYDISEYYCIDPMYGSMTDFNELLTQSHARNLKVIMDIVVNHTSTEHRWFKQALTGVESPYRDYYIFKKGNPGVPNNWQSKFGGSAWQFDEVSSEYYLHLFAKEQADLNWENPKVREEVKRIIEFWAKKGVDGFRLDVINLISKQQNFPNDDQGDGRRFYTDGPRVHEYLQEISRDIFQKYGSVTVGEMSSTTVEQCQQYSNYQGTELSMVFNFHHLKVDYLNGEKWHMGKCDFIKLKHIFNQWQTAMHNVGWNALFWCNHDQPRIVSRFGNIGEYRIESAKMLATMIYFMQGTPYIYQGEEIGMTNPNYLSIGDYRDIESLNMYQILCDKGMSEVDVLRVLSQKSRDNSRTPMQWNSELNSGFSDGQSWLKVAENYQEINVEDNINDENSIFAFYQRIIYLRKKENLIRLGDYQDLAAQHLSVFCYQRSYVNNVENGGAENNFNIQGENKSEERLLIIGNFYKELVTYKLPYSVENAKVLINNYQQVEINEDKIILKPYQALVWKVLDN